MSRQHPFHLDHARKVTKKLRIDPSGSQGQVEASSPSVHLRLNLSERDFEDITNKIENRKAKRLRDTEFEKSEILRLIEKLSSKVGRRRCSAMRLESNESVAEELQETCSTGNASLNNN